ncbi:MAG: hypothetical protein FWC34_00450 [Bacteroidetes bacterium]|nr:hypothetical protein [Bacteroidota bacterium]
METKNQSFSFDHDTSVEVVIINGAPHFVAVDVCNALDLQNPTERVKITLDTDEYLPYVIHRSGQQRTVNVVTESGLYALILKSRKPNAKKFRRWITSEVLPAIRKTGMYVNEQVVEKLSGQNIKITGADNNFYLLSILKAFRDFIGEEGKGYLNSIPTFVKKIEAAQTLFPEDKMSLRNKNVKVQ